MNVCTPSMTAGKVHLPYSPPRLHILPLKFLARGHDTECQVKGKESIKTQTWKREVYLSSPPLEKTQNYFLYFWWRKGPRRRMICSCPRCRWRSTPYFWRQHHQDGLEAKLPVWEREVSQEPRTEVPDRRTILQIRVHTGIVFGSWPRAGPALAMRKILRSSSYF